MSKRESHIYHLSTSSKLNLSFDEVLKKSNNIKKKVLSFVQKNNYSCLMFMSISCVNTHFAQVNVGFRGKKSIVKNKKHKNDNPIVNPHLHIVIFANPGETLSKYIQNVINKEFKEDCTWSTHAKKEYKWRKFITYDIEQAVKERTLCNNIEILPKDRVEEFLDYFEYLNLLRKGVNPVFKGISNKYFEKYHNKNRVVENDPFTLSEEQETVKPLDTSEFETILENQDNYNVICDNNKYNKYNKSNKLDMLNDVNRPIKLIPSNHPINCQHIYQTNSS